MTLRLARLEAGAVVPYAQDPDLRRAWALSEVGVAAHRIAACPPPPELQAAVDAARARWGRWERESPMVLCAVLAAEGDRWRFAVTNGNGDQVIAFYDATSGLFYCN